jgi:hypothetical protein
MVIKGKKKKKSMITSSDSFNAFSFCCAVMLFSAAPVHRYAGMVSLNRMVKLGQYISKRQLLSGAVMYLKCMILHIISEIASVES